MKFQNGEFFHGSVLISGFSFLSLRHLGTPQGKRLQPARAGGADLGVLLGKMCVCNCGEKIKLQNKENNLQENKFGCVQIREEAMNGKVHFAESNPVLGHLVFRQWFLNFCVLSTSKCKPNLSGTPALLSAQNGLYDACYLITSGAFIFSYLMGLCLFCLFIREYIYLKDTA